MENIIKIQNLTKYYLRGKVLGIKDINLEIKRGEVFGFLGPNGAGKSTTIRVLLDLIRATSGSARIFNKDIHKNTVEIKENIGYLPGEIYLPEDMTGLECINYYKNFKKKVEDKYLNGLIEKFYLDTKKRIRTYSSGNKQKLAIILALMHKPKLLILDEPTGGLDPLNQKTFYNCIFETKKFGTTTFFSTHILPEAEKICDRIGIIKDGDLKTVKTLKEFHKNNIRKIIIRTRDKILLEKFNTIKSEKTKTGYILTIKGENGEIIKKLSKYNIVDIRVEEPTLEEIFIHYYE
jgi:ABC-2 type transport system ATP-binding protein